MNDQFDELAKFVLFLRRFFGCGCIGPLPLAPSSSDSPRCRAVAAGGEGVWGRGRGARTTSPLWPPSPSDGEGNRKRGAIPEKITSRGNDLVIGLQLLSQTCLCRVGIKSVTIFHAIVAMLESGFRGLDAAFGISESVARSLLIVFTQPSQATVPLFQREVFQ